MSASAGVVQSTREGCRRYGTRDLQRASGCVLQWKGMEEVEAYPCEFEEGVDLRRREVLMQPGCDLEFRLASERPVWHFAALRRVCFGVESLVRIGGDGVLDSKARKRVRHSFNDGGPRTTEETGVAGVKSVQVGDQSEIVDEEARRAVRMRASYLDGTGANRRVREAEVINEMAGASNSRDTSERKAVELASVVPTSGYRTYQRMQRGASVRAECGRC